MRLFQQRTLIVNSLRVAQDLLEKKSAIYSDRPRMTLHVDWCVDVLVMFEGLNDELSYLLAWDGTVLRSRCATERDYVSTENGYRRCFPTKTPSCSIKVCNAVRRTSCSQTLSSLRGISGNTLLGIVQHSILRLPHNCALQISCRCSLRGHLWTSSDLHE